MLIFGKKEIRTENVLFKDHIRGLLKFEFPFNNHQNLKITYFEYIGQKLLLKQHKK